MIVVRDVRICLQEAEISNGKAGETRIGFLNGAIRQELAVQSCVAAGINDRHRYGTSLQQSKSVVRLR